MLRVRQLREARGIQQKELAIDLGVTQPTISDWESGRKIPSARSTQKIADYFEVSVDYLLGRDTQKSDGVKVPVLGDVAAGIPIEAITDILDYEEIDLELAKTGEYFGLRVKGKSMEPRMKEGDVVIVRRQESADTGDTVVVLVNGDSATVKKIKYGPDGITLLPTNPVFDPLFYTCAEVKDLPVRVIGRVVELRAKF